MISTFARGRALLPDKDYQLSPFLTTMSWPRD